MTFFQVVLLFNLETFIAGVIGIQDYNSVHCNATNVQEIRRKIILNLAVNISVLFQIFCLTPCLFNVSQKLCYFILCQLDKIPQMTNCVMYVKMHNSKYWHLLYRNNQSFGNRNTWLYKFIFACI